MSRKPRNRRGMPQPPQVKVTIRKIEDLERFKSVSFILEMTKKIIQKTNEENKQNKMFLPIQLDEGSVRRLVEEEKLVEAAKTAAEETAQEETSGEENGADKVSNEQDNVVTEGVPSKPVNEESGPKFAAVVKGNEEQTDAIKGPVITARALYVVPPKMSRRRGVKSGCAYLVLNGPSVASSEEEYANMSQGERSRVAAKARLQLSTAVEALSIHGQEDAKASQEYGGCLIQQSISGKAWKANYYDNREGTIETTADYKRFIAKMGKEEEERMSRPRPTPGGAMGDADAAENGEPVAAIVLHLQAKRKQEARRRKASAKMTNGGIETKSQNKSNKLKDDVTKGSRRSRREGKKKGGGKKKEKAPPKPAPMPAPVMSAAEFPTLWI